MSRILLIGVALLLLGPLRRRAMFPFLAAWWRNLVALSFGTVAGFAAVGMMHGAPAWMMLFGPVVGAFVVGGGVRELIDCIFPPKGK